MDWLTAPVMSPGDIIQTGVTGQGLDQAKPPRAKPFDFEELIEDFTIIGAHRHFRDGILGRLEVGERADLIVGDQYIF